MLIRTVFISFHQLARQSTALVDPPSGPPMLGTVSFHTTIQQPNHGYGTHAAVCRCDGYFGHCLVTKDTTAGTSNTSTMEETELGSVPRNMARDALVRESAKDTYRLRCGHHCTVDAWSRGPRAPVTRPPVFRGLVKPPSRSTESHYHISPSGGTESHSGGIEGHCHISPTSPSIDSDLLSRP